MAIFSSFERNRNIERTRSGLAAARARGRVGGENRHFLKKMLNKLESYLLILK
jgi:DNA invertase Pin-like site-specific DNA recombinase|nr:DNA-invertase [Klebsiella pneumoniae]